jgi:hypothetical protein
MFNLEAAIAEWRRQLLAAGIKTPVPMEELECHLREDMERQAKSGLDAQAAFEVAVLRIGPANLLKSEFKKIELLAAVRKEKGMRIFCVIFPVFYFVICFYSLLKTEMSWAQRILGLTAVALSDIFICYAPYFHKCLPLIQHKKVRMTIQIIPLLAWMICAGLFMNFVLLWLDLTQSQLTVSVLWVLAPAAVIGSFGYGLDNAARKHIATADL